jgi:excisionase family DNA binding protein
MSTNTTTWTPAKAMYRIPEVVEIISLSRSFIYELIRSGELKTVQVGGARRVTAQAIIDYLATLTDEAGAA